MPNDEKPSEKDASTTITPGVTIPQQHLDDDDPPSSSSPIIMSNSNRDDDEAAGDGEKNAMATTTSNDDADAAEESVSNNPPPLTTSTGNNNNNNSSGGGGRIVILQSGAGMRRQTRKKQRQRQMIPASVEEEQGEQPAAEPTPGGAANNNEDWANQVPGAWAIHGIDRPTALPQETPNDEMGRRRHRHRPGTTPDDTDASAGSSTSSSRIRSSARSSGTAGYNNTSTAEGESSSAGLVEATLVTEPQLVHAVPWDEVQRQQAQARADRRLAQQQQQQPTSSAEDNNPSPQDNNDNDNDTGDEQEEVVNKIIRTALQEERQRNQRTCHYRIWIGLLLVFVIGAGVVGALFGLGVIDTSSGSSSKSSSSSDSTSAASPPPSSPLDADDSPADAPSSSSSSSSSSPAENESLTARCVQAPIEIPVSGSSEDCQSGVQVFASLVDRGSSSSVPLTSLRLVPPGPFKVGWHNVSLVAVDSVGRTDSCLATIVVMDELTEWTFFQNHAYRVRSCQLNWPDALQAVQASATTLCGSTAPSHLATITSQAERNVVRDLARSLNLGQEEFWLGGYQPELADEPAGNWTWVNGEGLIFDGYTDWDPGEPNSASEDCMVMLGAKRGFRWDDRPCHRTRYRYIEEVDLPQQQNVMVDGCDSGVPDRLQDATTCAYLITPALQANCSSLKTNHDDVEDNGDYRACVQEFLMTLVEQGELSLLDQEKILNCGSDNQPPIAVCQDVEISVDPAAEVVNLVVNASMFDNGSSDPDGDWPLRLELLHQQPLLMVAGQSLDAVLGNHAVTLLVADGRGGQDSCQATLTITDGNQPPIAKCRNVLEMTGDSLCSGIKRIDGSQIDNGSVDPEGAFVEFLDVIPAGPYDVGSNYTLTLTVKDNRGQMDACNTTLLVKSRVTWEVFENQHAYRAQVCNMEYWDTANQSAAAVSLCGARAHLATITSVQERDAVVDMVTGLMLLGGGGLDELWLGGYQPEQAVNPRDNWTWVNNEGQIFDGYTDWDSDEPNKKDEDCLAMDSDSGFRWNNKECSNQFRYIEEVDLERTVAIDGCDSGVPDVLINVESCSYAIAEGISRCRLSVPALFSVCLDLYLDGLVVNGNITTNQKDAIAQCADITPSSSSSSTNSTARHLRG